MKIEIDWGASVRFSDLITRAMEKTFGPNIAILMGKNGLTTQHEPTAQGIREICDLVSVYGEPVMIQVQHSDPLVPPMEA